MPHRLPSFPGRFLLAGIFVLSLICIPSSRASTWYWDADLTGTGNVLPTTGLGGTGTWDLSTLNWWDGLSASDVAWPNSATDMAVFAGANGVVTLSGGLTAGGLRFDRTQMTLTGGSLTLAGNPVLGASMFAYGRIDSVLNGSSGLTKTGQGTLLLTNPSNTFTGATTVNNGTLVATSQGALGGSAALPVTVTGSNTVGAAGGNLLLLSSWASTLDFARALSLNGGGVYNIGNIGSATGSTTLGGAALTTLGQVHLTGAIQTSLGGVADTRIASGFGDLTLSGTVTMSQTTVRNLVTQGAGGILIDGKLTGIGNLIKNGTGGLTLTNTANDFTGIVRVDAGSLRISTAAVLGANTTAAAISLGSGTLEIRTDTPDFQSKSITLTASGSFLFVDRGINGSGMNQIVDFGDFTFGAASRNLIVNGRNGYGVYLTGASGIIGGGGSGPTTFTSNGDGLVTLAADLWNNADTTGARNLTLSGPGKILVTGSILATGAAHTFTKAGTGTVTLLGTSATYTGATTTSGGALLIAGFGALGASPSSSTVAVNVGNVATPGILTYLGASGTGAGETSTRVINLGGTTGGAILNANQTGTAPTPLILTSAFTATGADTKTLTLAGTSTLDNTIAGAIVNNSTANITLLRKAGPGTWVLSGANTFTGAVQISDGVLKLADTFSGSSRNVLGNTVGVGFVTDTTNLSAGGTFAYVGAAGSASTETTGPLMLSAGAGTVKVTSGAGGTAVLTLAGIGTSMNTSAASSASTTITVASTAGLVPGMVIGGGSAAATINAITSGTTFTASSAQTLLSGAPLTFTRPGGNSVNSGATVNFVTDSGSSVVLASVAAVGFINSYTTFNGADFAYAPTTTNATLRAPIYGTDSGFVTSAGGANKLTANNHNQLTGSVTGQVAITINSLKMVGSNSLATIGLLTISTGGIIQTGGSGTISGGNITTGGAVDMVIRVNGSTDVLTLSSQINATTTGGLTKTGAGTLIIAAGNNQTSAGATNINEGTVQMSGSNSRLSSASTNLNIRQGAILDLNGVSTTINATASSIGALNGAGTIQNTSGTAAVFAIGSGTTGGTGTFSGTIKETSGKISVVKLGTTNSQIWTGISNYTGSTTIGVAGTATSGSLTVSYLADIGSDSSIGRGDMTNNAGSLIFAGTTGGISYAGDATISINRQFTLSGTGAGAGGRLGANGLNNAAIVWNSTAPLTFGSADAQTLTLNGSSTGDNQINMQLINNGTAATSISKAEAGLWILGNSSNTYTGSTTISGGALRASEGTSLPSASPVILSGGVLETSGNLTRSLTATAVNGQNTVTFAAAGGGGFAASTAKLAVNLGGSGSTLVWGGTGGFVPAGAALILNSTTALFDVELLNGIDLNAGVRNITVNENANTSFDYATISGAIIGAAGSGIIKDGDGRLQLLGANTYNGPTSVNAGTLLVNSIGSTGVSTSSLGSGASALNLSNGTTATALIYVGGGETSARLINLAGANTTAASTTAPGATTIESSGSGALKLTNVVASGDYLASLTKTLTLQGQNTDANEISSVLANSAQGGQLAITKTGGGVWILSGNNSGMSGNITVSAGVLGIGHTNAFGTGTVALNNSGLMASGADITFNNAVTLADATSAFFTGSYSLTLGGSFTIIGNTSNTVTNSIDPSTGTLTFNGAVMLNSTTAKTLIFNGSGNTIINGVVGQSDQNLALTYTGDGTLTLTGANTYKGTTTLNNALGKLNLTGSGKLGSGALTVTAGTLTINSVDQSVALLTMGSLANAASTITIGSGVTLSQAGITYSGTTSQVATINGSGTLALGSSDFTVTVADNPTLAVDMSWAMGTLTGSGTFIKAGAGTLDISGIATNSFSGSYQVTAGAIVGLSASNNLALNGGVYQGSGTFTRDLGTGSGQAQFLNGGGGFAAVGGSLTVTLGSTADPLVWGSTASFLPDGAPLILGTTSADNTVTLTNNIDLNGASRTVNTVNNSASTADKAVLSGVLSNGSLTKTGDGVLQLSGANTLNGSVIVNAGTLLVNNLSGSGTGDANVFVDTGATLGGNGTIAPGINNSINVGGTLSVGNPDSLVGEHLAMMVQGNGTITLGKAVEFNLFSNAGTGILNDSLANDMLIVGAPDWLNLQIAPGARLNVTTALNTNSWVAGDSWKLFDWSGIAGGTAPTAWAGIVTLPDLDTLNTGRAWDINQLFTTGVITVMIVPEPTRAALMLIALGMTLARRSRKKV